MNDIYRTDERFYLAAQGGEWISSYEWNGLYLAARWTRDKAQAMEICRREAIRIKDAMPTINIQSINIDC